jgi:hypothetical protein
MMSFREQARWAKVMFHRGKLAALAGHLTKIVIKVE